MLCVPTASAEVENLATPLLLRPAFSRSVVPSMKLTVPVGMRLPCPVTVAVNDTLCPKLDGLTEDTNDVVVPMLINTPTALRANISETLPVVVINEQGEEEKNKDEQEFSWCCLSGRG